jgi:cytidylate kinase
MPLPIIIAIDGPVASGKSTVGKRLAERLGYLFFDTGLMYRAMTYLVLRAGIPVTDRSALAQFADGHEIDIRPPTEAERDGRDATVVADGEDITTALRSREVEENVSPVAAVPEVRAILTAAMRRVGLRGQVVMVGRDVGTTILPEADSKIFLTASVETRAQRRYDEVSARGEDRSYDDILANLAERDRIDSSRHTAPLRPADDATQIDTSGLALDEAVVLLERHVTHQPARN